MHPAAPRIGDEASPEADPEQLSDKRAVRLRNLKNLIAHAPIAAEKIDPAFWNVGQHQPTVNPPEKIGGERPKQGVVASRTLAEDNVRLVLTQPIEKGDDQLRWFLQVRSHSREIVTVTNFETGSDRAESAEVTAMKDNFRPAGYPLTSLDQERP